MKTVLIIGACGSGKTWAIKQLMLATGAVGVGRVSSIWFVKNGENVFLGRYTGEMYEGSDKLSMAVAKDFLGLRSVQRQLEWNIVAEGDRFMNQKFISMFNPFIVKIGDDGSAGRSMRNSKQSAQHLKRIETRVRNIKPNITVANSSEAVRAVMAYLTKEITR